jgi:hypothetical protein
MKYAILETTKRVNRAGGERFTMHWAHVAPNSNSYSMTAAGSERDNLRTPSQDFYYPDREQAEQGAQHFRDQNAREVERDKRCRPWNRTYPSVIEIVEFEQ